MNAPTRHITETIIFVLSYLFLGFRIKREFPCLPFLGPLGMRSAHKNKTLTCFPKKQLQTFGNDWPRQSCRSVASLDNDTASCVFLHVSYIVRLFPICSHVLIYVSYIVPIYSYNVCSYVFIYVSYAQTLMLVKCIALIHPVPKLVQFSYFHTTL